MIFRFEIYILCQPLQVPTNEEENAARLLSTHGWSFLLPRCVEEAWLLVCIRNQVDIANESLPEITGRTTNAYTYAGCIRIVMDKMAALKRFLSMCLLGTYFLKEILRLLNILLYGPYLSSALLVTSIFLVLILLTFLNHSQNSNQVNCDRNVRVSLL